MIPERLEGSRILDLGSGSGRDCYVLSKLVGESGHVTGVDMTAAQVRLAVHGGLRRVGPGSRLLSGSEARIQSCWGRGSLCHSSGSWGAGVPAAEGALGGSWAPSPQVEVARKHIGYHTEKFGYQTPNVDFLQGYLESLGDAGLQDESYDIVM